MAFTVNGKVFRYRCDSSEYSFQVCQKWISTEGGNCKDLKIHKIDDTSFGVYDKNIEAWVYPVLVVES